jgi:zinc protease
MRIPLMLSLLLALLISSASAATPAAVDIPIPDIPYTKFVLKNGLTVLVHEDHKSPVVAVAPRTRGLARPASPTCSST